MDKKIAGVVLAGGRSSRMGHDKALLDYNGVSLLDHMIGILAESGLTDIYVSGDFDGYRCIPDRAPHEGPAWAIYDVLQQLQGYDGVIFVPVDMPLLHANALHLLMKQKGGAYFVDYPLPTFITKASLEGRSKSVKGFLEMLKISPIILPSELAFCMANTNTPEEWQEVFPT